MDDTMGWVHYHNSSDSCFYWKIEDGASCAEPREGFLGSKYEIEEGED